MSPTRMSMIELDDAPVALDTVKPPLAIVAPPVVVHTKEANGSAIGSEGALSSRTSGQVSSAHDLAIKADLAWNPEIAPLNVAGVEVSPELGRAVVRSDNRAPIGIVGKRYSVIPHTVRGRSGENASQPARMEASRMALNKRDALRLRAVVRNLEALCNPADGKCGVRAAHKDAVRLYVQTWVIPRVEAVLNGNDWDSGAEEWCVINDAAATPVPYGKREP